MAAIVDAEVIGTCREIQTNSSAHARGVVTLKMVSPTKPDEGHVLFWITEEDGREFATCAAATFRAAMTERDELRAENERLRNGLQAALDALDWILAAQQPLRDPWFAHRDALIGRAREALGRHIDG